MTPPTKLSSIDWAITSSGTTSFISVDQVFASAGVLPPPIIIPTTLQLSTLGPSRPASTPAIIFESGLGVLWTPVQRILSSEYRTYTYTHAGLGPCRSSTSLRNGDRSATSLAAEGVALVKAAGIEPPFILVGQSYGGVIVREFLALAQEIWADKDAVVGLVLVDANCERVPERPVDEADIEEWVQAGKLDYLEETGLNACHKMLPDEWTALHDGSLFGGAGEHGEWQAYKPSCRALGRREQYTKKVLGDWPVSVVKGDTAGDLRKLVGALEARKVRSEEERKEMAEKVERYALLDDELQRAQLGLSDCGRVVDAGSGSGHNVQYTQPGIVADEVRWVISKWEIKAGRKVKALG